MKTIIKTVNLSQTKAKSMFKKHATGIVKELRSKGIRMIKKIEYHESVNSFVWTSCINKKSYANIHIRIKQVHMEHESGVYDQDVHWVDFTARINSQKELYLEDNLEKMLIIKTEKMLNRYFPLSNTQFRVFVEEPKIPNLNPEKIVARQLYLALKIYKKMYSPKTISKLKQAVKKETDAMAESFFQ